MAWQDLPGKRTARDTPVAGMAGAVRRPAVGRVLLLLSVSSGITDWGGAGITAG